MALSREVYGQVPSRTPVPKCTGRMAALASRAAWLQAEGQDTGIGPPPRLRWGLRVEAEGEDAGLSSSRLALKAEG